MTIHSLNYTMLTTLLSLSLPVGNFTEVPQNTTCVLGQTFSVRCQPPLHSSGARWMYGEERLFVTHPPAGINATSRGILFQLLITCTLERHYITVQCIAIVVLGVKEEESPAALIRVQGEGTSGNLDSCSFFFFFLWCQDTVP